MVQLRSFLLASLITGVLSGPAQLAKTTTSTFTHRHPTATVDVGEVIGATTIVPSTVIVNEYLGIPFAVSPPERFSAPKPVSKFKKPVVAQKWRPACIQQYNF
jgi:carboxylesterase type B